MEGAMQGGSCTSARWKQQQYLHRHSPRTLPRGAPCLIPRTSSRSRTKRQAGGAGGAVSMSAEVPATSASEPAWKQKLAAAELFAEQTRQATARAQEEYRRRLAQKEREGRGQEGTPLVELPWVAYLADDGKIADCSDPNAKASVYAIFDAQQGLQYVGVSRQVYQSMRLHFARCPSLCHWVKVQHIVRPSRLTLESIREQWIEESGGRGAVPGNDNGPVQHRWENAVDCKPLMTEEEKAAVASAAPGPPKAKALKNVARRVEGELAAAFAARQCTEVLRFDPKLKEEGLLDLKSTAHAPETSVPKEKPK